MALSRKELALLRIGDGIATTQDRERLSQGHTSGELDAWTRLPSLVREFLTDPHGAVDVAEAVVEDIHGLDDSLSQSIRAALQDDIPIDLTTEIMGVLNLTDSSMQNLSEWMNDPEPVDFGASTDSIMAKIMAFSDRESDSFDLDSLIGDLIEEDVQHAAVKHQEPQLHVVTQELNIVKNPVDSESHGAEYLSVVEFTEDIEIETPELVSIYLLEEEEDSDEICFLDEIHVDEHILEQQSQDISVYLHTIQQALQPEDQAPIDIWSSVRPKLTQPPLRFVRDEIEVVDKYPEVVEETSTQVEFLNSKSIDADSTISKVSMTVLGAFLTLAALWLVMVLPSMVTRTSGQISTPARPIVTFEVAEINELEVEDLEVAENVNVQILQGEENAPTIIFIDDVEEI